MIKTLDFQINSCESNLREYINKTNTIFEKNTNENLNDMNMRITEVKMENNKYSYELKKNSDQLIKELEHLSKLKEDINKKYESSLWSMHEINKQTNENFDGLKVEFNQVHAKFTDLAEFIKVLIYNLNQYRMLDLEKILVGMRYVRQSSIKWLKRLPAAAMSVIKV